MVIRKLLPDVLLTPIAPIRPRRYPPRRKALSLLEVVLALAILAMSAAILAQISWTATDNGLLAHRLSTAQILAESKMAEVVTGAISPQGSAGWTQITDSVPNGTWYYQVTATIAARKDMVGIRLAITDERGRAENTELFYVARWMIDPSLGLDTPQSSSSGASSGAASGTGSPSAGGIQ